MSIAAASCAQAACGAPYAQALGASAGSGDAYRALAAQCAAASGADAREVAQIATPQEALCQALQGTSTFAPASGLALGEAPEGGIDAALMLLRAFASSNGSSAAAASDPLSDLESALKLLKSAASSALSSQSQTALARVSVQIDPAYLPFARCLAGPLGKAAAALLRKKSFTKRRRKEKERAAARQRALESGFAADFTFFPQMA
ncbi:MAG: hypothetical protein PUI29_00725 [Aeromonadales bacterium]|nr:hypothetical protein [Aeromonadales bacterium]MDY2890883.1 hypothetical protein [Succinivibrio sp.]